MRKPSDPARFLPGMLTLALLLGGALFLYVLWSCGGYMFFFPPRHAADYSRRDFVLSRQRTVSDQLAAARERDGVLPPGRPWYGPLSREIRSAAGIRDEDAVDPFNHDGPREDWLTAPRFATDRGPWVTPRGMPFWYLTDGKKLFVLLSRGPDGDVDLGQTEAEALMVLDEERQYPASRLFQYDVTNGTGSSGDLFRFSR